MTDACRGPGRSPNVLKDLQDEAQKAIRGIVRGVMRAASSEVVKAVLEVVRAVLEVVKAVSEVVKVVWGLN